MHVLARGQHARVADGVAAGARLDVLAVERVHQCPKFVVRDDLAQAELEVLEEGFQHLVLRRFLESSRSQRLAVGRLAEHAAESFFHHILDFFDAALGIRAFVD